MKLYQYLTLNTLDDSLAHSTLKDNHKENEKIAIDITQTHSHHTTKSIQQSKIKCRNNDSLISLSYEYLRKLSSFNSSSFVYHLQRVMVLLYGAVSAVAYKMFK